MRLFYHSILISLRIFRSKAMKQIQQQHLGSLIMYADYVHMLLLPAISNSHPDLMVRHPLPCRRRPLLSSRWSVGSFHFNPGRQYYRTHVRWNKHASGTQYRTTTLPPCGGVLRESLFPVAHISPSGSLKASK